MDLNQVRYFLVLARTLNFTRAAEECDVAQPTLTKAIQRLERELGGDLLHRERQWTHLTDFGKTILPLLEQTLAAADSVANRASRYHRADIASLGIGLISSISPTLLAPSLAELGNAIPDLRVDLFESKREDLIEMLMQGAIQAALVGDIANAPERIDKWVLFEEPYVVAVARSNPLAECTVVPVDMLGRSPWLEQIGCEDDPFGKIRGMMPGSDLTVKYRSSSEGHLQHLAAAGLGIVLSPLGSASPSNLAKVRIEGDPVWRRVHLLAMAGRRHSAALKTFIRIIRASSFKAAVLRDQMERRTISVLDAPVATSAWRSCERRTSLGRDNPKPMPEPKGSGIELDQLMR